MSWNLEYGRFNKKSRIIIIIIIIYHPERERERERERGCEESNVGLGERNGEESKERERGSGKRP